MKGKDKRKAVTKRVGITIEWKTVERHNHERLIDREKTKIKKDRPILNKSNGGEGRIAKRKIR